MALHDAAPRGGSLALVSILCSAHFVSSIDRHVLTLVLSPVGADLHLNDTQLGLLVGTAYVSLYAVACIPAGMLIDRFNRRNIVMAALALWSIGTALCALAESFAGIAIGRMVIGAGQAALVPAAMSLIAASVPERQIGTAVAAFTASSTLGRGAALFGGGALLAWIAAGHLAGLPDGMAPWRILFLLSLGLNGAVLLSILCVSEPPRAASPLQPPLLAFKILGRKWPIYLAYLGCAVANLLLIQIVAAWSPTLLVRLFQISPAQSGLFLGGVVLISGPLGNLCGGSATDWLKRRNWKSAPATVAIVALTAAPFGVTALCLAGNVWIAVAALGATTFALGAATPTALAAIQTLTPPQLRGRVSAVFVLIVTLVSLGIGPVSVGWLSDHVFTWPTGLSPAILAVVWPVSLLGIASAAVARVKGD